MDELDDMEQEVLRDALQVYGHVQTFARDAVCSSDAERDNARIRMHILERVKAKLLHG
jgi:hypothetical protein